MTLDAVVKLGGSLIGAPELPRLLQTLDELSRSRALVVVPGGGPFADAVRETCRLHDPGPSTAHWMAILAMDQHAHLLAGLLPAAALARDAPEAREIAASSRLALLAPYAWLRRTDPLPRGWHVTSDSIAAWIATQLGSPRLVLLKSVEGLSDADGALVPEASPEDAAAGNVVDEHFPQALAPSLECWILNGLHPDRLVELFREGHTRGTRILQ